MLFRASSAALLVACSGGGHVEHASIDDSPTSGRQPPALDSPSCTEAELVAFSPGEGDVERHVLPLESFESRRDRRERREAVPCRPGESDDECRERAKFETGAQSASIAADSGGVEAEVVADGDRLTLTGESERELVETLSRMHEAGTDVEVQRIVASDDPDSRQAIAVTVEDPGRSVTVLRRRLELQWHSELEAVAAAAQLDDRAHAAELSVEQIDIAATPTGVMVTAVVSC